ncbi:Protein kinase, catalytic domain-containing protein [Cynara cardunculus var. scolymus]|uniref:Protein kinase, catalytic domain-containing protein n=1 Tax=Cynara cardunculus var. scolymus TaxID=59895 RepID=A0A124SG71_CYNCS|nr:Protein kinase, catalytic domain-containing protein [Cynara cardunculus var. scolymus]
MGRFADNEEFQSEWTTRRKMFDVQLGLGRGGGLEGTADAAHGLKYLHDDVGPQYRVIHRDIKSSNILLDDNWKAKISDFGLSKIGPANVPFTFLISKACGTIGYVDPEYVKTGVLSQKSDVFSFGVVLFEVLCGRLAHGVQYQDESQVLYKLVKHHYEKGTLKAIIDYNLQKQIDSVSLSRFSAIAYKCLMKRREDRPTMSQIVEQLQKALNYQLAAASGWPGSALQQGPSTSKDNMTQSGYL